MHRLQELVRLHRLGLTERRAAKELRIGRNTAREYRRALQAAGVLEGSPDELPELESLKAIVMKALPSRPAPQQVSKLEAWQAEVEALLEKRLGPQAIYDRLRLEHADFQGSIGGLKRLVRRLQRSRAPLAIDHGFLRDDADAIVLADGVELLRELTAREPLVRYAARETRPGADVPAFAHVRDAARGFFHPTGTCALGRVVNPAGRVHGYAGLVVADASIMPTIPRANTNLTTAAIAERIAELI